MQKVTNLYIPHGSNETDRENIGINIWESFISHMVQMKRSQNLPRHQNYCLYIPHGSNETDMQVSSMIQPLQTLYPTWFKWNSFNSCSFRLTHSVYIPHGSNETMCSEEQGPSPCWLFISHMVQMKPYGDYKAASLTRRLYPTWFKWNSANILLAVIWVSSLYPTWFKWNYNVCSC